MVINSSVVSLPFSDHNTQQTHTNNSNSDAEEDVQVQEQRLKLCVYLASSSIFAHFFERKGGLTLKKKKWQPWNRLHFTGRCLPSSVIREIILSLFLHSLGICEIICGRLLDLLTDPCWDQDCCLKSESQQGNSETQFTFKMKSYLIKKTLVNTNWNYSFFRGEIASFDITFNIAALSCERTT